MKTSKLQVLPVIVLLTLFLLLAMGLALLSSSAYSRIVQTADAVSEHRTALSYMMSQVRRNDLTGGVSIGRFGESDAVYLRTEGYVTVLYVYEDRLRELYMEEDGGLTPADGLAIAPLRSLSVTVQRELLHLAVQDTAGTVHTAAVMPRCGIQEEQT